MDSPPKLSSETLIVHHIPLVHCQVPGGRQGGCGSSLKRCNPFSPLENLGLSRTTSLPERDVLHREAVLCSSLIQTCTGSWSSHDGGRGNKGGRRGGSMASDDSSFTSSNSEEQLITAHTLPRAKPRNRNPLRHNPFLLNARNNNDEDDEDDGDNLHGYLEDSSFHLHSDTNSTLDDAIVPFRLHDLDFSSEFFLLHSSGVGSSREYLRGAASDLSNHLEDLDILCLDSQHHHGSRDSNMSMDCGEKDWADDDDEDDEDHLMRCGRSSKMDSFSSSSSAQNFSCCALSQNYPEQFPEPFSETFSEFQQCYGSDSSCNSSDGVLVNFSTIFNKMNNSVPQKPQAVGSTNFNCSTDHSCISPGSTGEAFYLDLHTSPTEPPQSQQQQLPCLSNNFPLIHAPHLSSSSTCSCSAEHQGSLDLDTNCNSYHPPHAGSSDDLTSCLQSHARLVVSTQNYYKLVTCDLSSQSSPSPVGSSVNSCSENNSKESPTPSQPSEYFLFRQRDDEEEDEESSQRNDGHEKDETMESQQEAGGAAPATIEGQLFIKVSPPVAGRSVTGGVTPSGNRLRSRSYDRDLDKCPGLGSSERMLSCPVRLNESAAQVHPPPPPPPRVTSFAEIARSKRRNGPVGGSPSLKASADVLSSTHSHSSVDSCPIPERQVESEVRGCSPVMFSRCYSHAGMERHLEGRATAKGGLSSSSALLPVLVRYSKDQRPTTLPIQPFSFHHQFSSRPVQPKPLLPHLTGYVSGMQACSSSGSSSGSGAPVGEDAAETEHSCQAGSVSAAAPPLESVRPSPLGSYSPVRLQGVPGSGTCSTCIPSPQPTHHCLNSAGSGLLQTPPTVKPGGGSVALLPSPTLSLGVKRGVVPLTLPAVQGPRFHCGPVHSGSLSLLGCLDSGKHTDHSKGHGTRTHNDGRSCKLQQSSSDFLLDYFSLTEKPPEEFCLSPNAASSSSSCSSLPSHMCVDLTQKRGLVKAVNTAVDLIVAHFGTSRDPDVKAKLGNSWVSPNVGHLILKYLCPALRDILQDGLKAYVLDLIIGQRRCQPWSIVEASTQLGPSTRVLHCLLSKVSQFLELTNNNMRLNAFIFGLLNLKSLEFWFNHLYTHEDIVAAHYNPWGFLPISQAVCKPLLEELLLLLQPLSLLPFDLDLLFEPHLLQKGEEQLRCKEKLCSVGQSANRSSRSTFQLMRGWRAIVSDRVRDSEVNMERVGLRQEGAWPRAEVGRGGMTHLWKDRAMEGLRMKGIRQESQKEGAELKGHQREDRQAGWWYQLRQSSQVYIDQSTEGSKFIKTEKRKKSSERQQNHPLPTREGVVEGAESNHGGEGGTSSSGSRGRPSWMGSPPELVLNQEKDSTPLLQVLGTEVQSAAQEERPPHGHSLRWSRLFGSTVGSPLRADTTEPRARTQKTRAPSGWMALDKSVMDLVALTIGAGSRKKAEPPASPTAAPPDRPTEIKQLSQRNVQALCHHIATEPGQLSFNKGDNLQVLRKASADWLLCSLGSTQGLVPIIYVTISSTEVSHDADGLKRL